MKTKTTITYPSLDFQDTDYMAAISRDDLETAQRLIDKAAQIAGYRILGWHGSQSDTFLEFDEAKIGMNMGKNPKIRASGFPMIHPLPRNVPG